MEVTMNITYKGHILLSFMLNCHPKSDFKDEVWAFNLSTTAIVAGGQPQFLIKSHNQ